MSDFLNNIARRAEPVRDFRPRIASRFESARPESHRSMDEDSSGVEDVGDTAREHGQASSARENVHLTAPTLGVVQMPELRAAVQPTMPQLQAVVPPGLSNSNSETSQNSGDQSVGQIVQHVDEDRENGPQDQPQTDRGLKDLQADLQSLASRVASLKTPQLQSTQSRVRPLLSEEPNSRAASIRIEVPRLVPVHGTLNAPPATPPTGQERPAKVRIAVPITQSSFAPPVRIPTVAPPEQVPSQRNQTPPSPTINVTIGRVEVKATQRSAATAAPAQKERPSSVLSLEEYIARRRSGGIS
jgi:hypothetical protein